MTPKLACPFCGSRLSSVENSRNSDALPIRGQLAGVELHEFWRERRCLTCQHRYQTKETVIHTTTSGGAL